MLTACKIFPIPNLQPEFYGTDAEDKRAYRQLRVRKLGRYVRIFPRNLDPDAPMSCMQVEIFGELYISKCFLMNSLVSSCPKTNNQTHTQKKQTNKQKSDNTEAEKLQIISPSMDSALLLAAQSAVYFSQSVFPNYHRFRAQLRKERGRIVGVKLICCHVVLADSIYALLKGQFSFK